MAEVNLKTEYIIVIVLGSVLLLLLLVFLCLMCVLMRRRRALCFRKRDSDQQPFILPDKTLEQRYGKNHVRGKSSSDKGKKAKGKQLKYSRLGGQSPNLRIPQGDPFAHNYLSNPMVDEDEMNVDWSNPVFDTEKARNRDAAICIQSWFRMVR